MRGQLSLHVDRAGFSDHERDVYAGTQVDLPEFEEDATRELLTGIRDALVLLAMVARADREAWRHVLNKFCKLAWYEVFKFDGADSFDRARFHITFHLNSPKHGWVADMLADLFSGLSAPPSAAFMRAVKKIGALRTCSRTHGMWLEIPVAVALYSHDYYRMRREKIDEQPQMERAWSVMKALCSKYGGWRFPVRLAAPAKAGKAATDQDDWLAECVFAVNPVDVSVGTHNQQVNTWLARYLAGVVSTCKGDEFSSFDLNMRFPYEHDAEANAARYIQTLGNMFEKMMCASSMSEESCPTVRNVDVNIKVRTRLVSDGRALLWPRRGPLPSAVSVCRCRGGDPEARTRMWRWLAYVLFSKHSRVLSSVASVSLSRVPLTAEDANTIAAVMASADPVSLLCAQQQSTDQRSQSEAPPHSDHALVFAKLRRGTKVTLMAMRPDDEIPATSASWVLPSDMGGVQVLGSMELNDGEGVASVLVPGYGICHVRQDQLVAETINRLASRPSAPITDLVLEFDCYMQQDSPRGLPRLLELVGPPLTCLELHFGSRWDMDLSSVFSSCSNLKVLVVGFVTVDAAWFLDKYNGSSMRLEELSWPFDNLSLVADELANSQSRLAQSLKRMVYHPIRDDACLDATLSMLDSNRKLRYFYMRAVSEVFKTREKDVEGFLHGNRVEIPGSLSLACRLAFLSISSPRHHHHEQSDSKRAKTRALSTSLRMSSVLADFSADRQVMSTIFDFAAPHVLRRVRFNCVPRFELW